MELRVMTSERILIVDDDLNARTAMAAVLTHAGYHPVTVDGSVDALKHLAESDPYDLVLSDLMMGKIDGMQLLDQVHVAHPEIPVVIVTAVHDVSMAMAAIRRGAYDYLLKPFANEQLLACVTRALLYRSLTMKNELFKQYLEQLVEARTEMLHKTLIDLERSYDITLEALGDALDLRDAETEGHSKRVTAYTLALARAAGLSPNQLRVIARGAFLHDIGKIAIPDAILLKPSKLDPAEMTLMREHCSLGHRILSKIPYLSEAAEIVYSHQERFDGTGYPRQLKKDEIPVGARIFALADTMDAITSDRPYRQGRSFEAAREEIARCAGTQFDPEIVEVYMRIPNEFWADLRKEITQHATQYSALRA
jgi:putative nucleotidyltransferase with HDIG domain